MDIVKAGWLERRTTILKNWKREWFILTNDARLLRMSSPSKQTKSPDDTFQLDRWREIRSGSERVSNDIQPPVGATRDQLMELVSGDGSIWVLCTETTDDLLAWQISFEDVRQAYIERMQRELAERTNTQIPKGRADFPYYVGFNDSDPPCEVYRAPDGSTHTVVYRDGYPEYSKGGSKPAETRAESIFDPFLFAPFMIFPLFPIMWW